MELVKRAIIFPWFDYGDYYGIEDGRIFFYMLMAVMKQIGEICLGLPFSPGILSLFTAIKTVLLIPFTAIKRGVQNGKTIRHHSI